jgi:GAF domain-containing protein
MSALPASTLTALLDIRLADRPVEEVLDQLVRIARDAIPETSAASITLVRGERAFTAAYAGELAHAADERQYESGYGPCIDAGLTNTLLMVQDMRTETRWPDYSTNVLPKGVMSSCSVPLPVVTDVVGGLNLYGTEPSTWPDLDVAVELASHVAVAIANAFTHQEATKLAADMQAAMASRAVIEQAKGIIMVARHCSPDEAFEVLSKASSTAGRKVRDIAREIVERATSR